MKQMGGWVYIMCSFNHSTLYVGVTSNIASRVYEHKNKVYPASFSAKYNCVKLVYYRRFELIIEAIAEEKRIKGGSRKKKEALINSMNPEWRDLYNEIMYL
jgi:putative endonuclease